MSALFGYTGFVGTYLLLNNKFDYFYNSKNIGDAKGKHFDIVYIACIPAKKWYANKYPIEDHLLIEGIKDILNTITANKVVLISTIDIYDNISNQSNEMTSINYATNHAYGKNRYLFEVFIKETFDTYYIIRLPALFGKGLKKNVIYDLLNNNNVDRIYINSAFQWYNLDWLDDDINVCVNNKIQECNLFTEPLDTKQVLTLFNYEYTNNPTDPYIYNTKTIYDKYFEYGKCGYIRNKDMVFDDIKLFINTYNIKPQYKLCVSNISNNLLFTQYYAILKYCGIKYIEIAPTKYCNWTNTDKLIDIKRDINKYDLNLYSFQSITYTITHNIFNETCAKLMKHLKKVIDIACKLGVKNLVFGCPRNRKIIDTKLDNDVIFIKFFKELGDYIEDRELIICIENNSKKYNCNYLNTIDQVGKIVNKIDHKNIKMMIDIGNCIMDNDDISNLVEYKDLIYHIHISAPYMKPLIKYNKNLYNKYAKLLNLINYNKIISLEFINENTNKINTLKQCIYNFRTLFYKNNI